MKKILSLFLVVFLFTGCEQKKESKFEGVPAGKKDFVALGVKYLNQSDVPKAVASFDQAIRQEPTKVENYLILGEVYLRLKEYVRAVDTFGAAVKVAPDSGEAFYFLALSKGLKSKIEKTPKLSEDSMKEAILAAQKSVEIFVKSRDDRFKKSVTLLRSLTEGKEINNQSIKEISALPAQKP